MDTSSSDTILRARLMRLARGLGHGEADAEDLVQECFLALARGSFRGDSSLQTWLYRVLLNKHADGVRSRTRRRFPVAPAVPASEAGLSETKECVRRAIAELSDSRQALLALKYFEGLSYSEIAGVLNRPESTLRAECCRAMESLCEILTRAHGEENVKEWL